MYKKSFNGVHQEVYVGSIILRMFKGNEKEMREFHDEYQSVLLRGPSSTPPTKEQIKMAEMYAQGALVREVAQKFKISQYKAESAINKVARLNLRNTK